MYDHEYDGYISGSTYRHYTIYIACIPRLQQSALSHVGASCAFLCNYSSLWTHLQKHKQQLQRLILCIDATRNLLVATGGTFLLQASNHVLYTKGLRQLVKKLTVSLIGGGIGQLYEDGWGTVTK